VSIVHAPTYRIVNILAWTFSWLDQSVQFYEILSTCESSLTVSHALSSRSVLL